MRGEAWGSGAGREPRSPGAQPPAERPAAFMAFSRNGKAVGAERADAPQRPCAPSPGCLRRARRHCILFASTGVLEQ